MARRHSNKDVYYTVEADGIGFALETIKANSIEDAALAELWASAQETIEEIRDYVEQFSGVDSEEEDSDDEEVEELAHGAY